MSTPAIAAADDATIADAPAPQPTHLSLVYPYSAAYPPGVLPLAAAPAAALLGAAAFGVL